jgi:hypothetical protein
MFPFADNFSIKSDLTDFCLVVEGREFWVPRGYLGTISPFFRKLCYQNETGKAGRAILENRKQEDILKFLNAAFDNPMCKEIDGKPNGR